MCWSWQLVINFGLFSKLLNIDLFISFDFFRNNLIKKIMKIVDITKI